MILDTYFLSGIGKGGGGGKMKRGKGRGKGGGVGNELQGGKDPERTKSIHKGRNPKAMQVNPVGTVGTQGVNS